MPEAPEIEIMRRKIESRLKGYQLYKLFMLISLGLFLYKRYILLVRVLIILIKTKEF